MTLFQFAKELMRGSSSVEFISGIIEESHSYIEKKRTAGRSGGQASLKHRLNNAQAPLKPEAVTETVAVAVASTVTDKKNKEHKTIAPDGVTEKTWSDFLSLRKKKNAPVTDTVISGLKREGDKAGVTLEEVMQECCVQGWRGFKAEWYKKPAQQQKITPVPDNYPYKPFSQVDPRLPR